MKTKQNISERMTTGIDNVISFFSPKAGFKRRMYREAINISHKFGATKGQAGIACAPHGFPEEARQTRICFPNYQISGNAAVI